MQNSMRALGGLMALALLAACGGDKEADSKVPPAAGKAAAAKAAAEGKAPAASPGKATAPAQGKAAAPAPAKSAAAPAKSAAPAKQATPVVAKKSIGDMKVPAGESKKAMREMKMPAGEMKHDMSAMKPGEKMAGMAGMAGMGEMSGWKELDAFHSVLQDAWHPVATGDLAPARAKAAELLTAALAWRSSKGPAKCDNAAARGGMASFIDDARSYADAAKRNASDDAIKVTLKRTHDGFEKIAEPCMADMMKGMKMDMPKKP